MQGIAVGILKPNVIAEKSHKCKYRCVSIVEGLEPSLLSMFKENRNWNTCALQAVRHAFCRYRRYVPGASFLFTRQHACRPDSAHCFLTSHLCGVQVTHLEDLFGISQGCNCTKVTCSHVVIFIHIYIYIGNSCFQIFRR